MALTDYTTNDDIRALLGVDQQELADSVMSLNTVEHTVSIALNSETGIVAPDTVERTFAQHHSFISAEGTPTLAQTMFKQKVELYAAYVGAAAVGGSLPMFAPKTKGDGKALVTRFSSEATFKDVLTCIYEMMGRLHKELLEEMGVTVDDVSLVTAVSPATDLVTNS